MKKSLIALAVLAASGAAFAQSTVTIYGVADVVIHKDKGVSTTMTSGGVSSSRLGFKGTEDLGGGLKANFKFEQGINLTNGAAGNFGREAWVGLSGGFGEVQLGNSYSALDNIAAASDPAFDSNVIDPTNILASRNYAFSPLRNISYISPSIGGFTGYASYSLPSASSVMSFAASYAAGPVAVAFGYQDDSDAGGDKYTTINGSYDLGMAKVLAGWGMTDVGDDKDFFVGVDVPLASNVVVSAGYAVSKPGVGDSKKSIGIAAAYLLSKRTTAYVGIRDDNAAATAAGGVDSRFGVGIKHTF
jgi:predicted porin